MVETIAAYGPYEPLGIRILPRALSGDHDFGYLHCSNTSSEIATVDAIPISDQIPRCRVPRKGVNHLLSSPPWIRGAPEPTVACTILRTRSRISLLTGGRPDHTTSCGVFLLDTQLCHLLVSLRPEAVPYPFYLRGDLMSKNFGRILVFCFAGLMSCGDLYAEVCGDGIRQGVEECDNGPQNSDSRPDACRTECVFPKCGDDVKDSKEECDDGHSNSDKIPNACRTNCKNPRCGDMVLDENEECDDGNDNSYDGCHECTLCFLPKDNLDLSNYYDTKIKLCPGRYELQDQGEEGIIIIKSYNITLDCQGAVIVGINPLMKKATGSVSGQIQQAAGQSLPDKSDGIGKRREDMKAGATAPVQSQGNQGTTPAPAPSYAYAYKGTGIVLRGGEVVLRDCVIEGFKTGVNIQSYDNVLFNNSFCNNTVGIYNVQQKNYGVKNKCSNVQNWQEDGKPGCTSACK